MKIIITIVKMRLEMDFSSNKTKQGYRADGPLRLNYLKKKKSIT